jgi:hypothetical protein
LGDVEDNIDVAVVMYVLNEEWYNIQLLIDLPASS